MGLEAKREGSFPEAGAPLLAVAGLARPARNASGRWFDAIDPDAPPPQRPRSWPWPPFFVAALLFVALGQGLARIIVPLILAGLGGVVRYLGIRARRRAVALPEKRGLHLAGGRLTYHGRKGQPPAVLLDENQLFGVTLLASPRRERVVVLLSSPSGTFYIGAGFGPATRRAFAPLIEGATIVTADEGGLSAIGPDGEPLLLAPDAFATLLDQLTALSPGCRERFLLTDARGLTVGLEGHELRAGGRTFDLRASIEWRAFVFQEPIGQAVALYQGTWIRQGTNEIVLVCLMPGLTPSPEGEGVSLASLDRRALRDLRLMQGPPEDPPPTEQRVAVDRLVMLPIRSALDKAPRPTAQPPRARC
ncbi:IMP dehydrogenase [Chondromyces crocatus]|uniref:IMP dehydrogenase n=1 Tax=Chondromyces crocatus TaxID=52 RepID=A0A0K1EGS2_CHOCO|nr:IMP dehydrogenase [Chondromyces crocatus]AKT39793.1 IMP dehydrogenase [Chondromyces crocatus]